MELIIGLVILVVTLALFDLAALRWGVNSRRAGGDFNQPGELDFYEPDGLTYK